MTEPLSKVDSAVQGLSSSPPKEEKKTRRQSSAAAPGVYNINDLGKLSLITPSDIGKHDMIASKDLFTDLLLQRPRELNSSSLPRLKRLDGKQLTLDVVDLAFRPRDIIIKTATDSSNRKINKSSSTVEDAAILKLHLTKPPVKRIALHFPLGLEVQARNLKGVTIKDALDAIHKAYKKRVCLQHLTLGH